MQKPEQADPRHDKRHRSVNNTHQDNENTELATQEFDVCKVKFLTCIMSDQC